MPRKIKDNEKNLNLFKRILLEINNNKNYDQISKELNIKKDFVYELVRFYKKIYNINSKVISKYDILKITNQMSIIIDLYKNGTSLEKIGEKYGVSERTVAHWLIKENVQLRSRGIISKINQNIFNEIDTEIKAYTIGLITADGSVSSKDNCISITLTKDDSYLLEIINEKLLDGLGNLIEYHKNDPKPRVVLQFNGKTLKKDLEKFGIIPRKTYKLDKLSTLIPNSLYHHYIRGLYDGDGVCSYYTNHKKKKVRIGFCAYNKIFVEDYQNYLVGRLKMSKTKLFNTGNCWQCSWGKEEDLKNFYNYIYKDATVFLGRKKKKLFEYVNTEVI